MLAGGTFLGILMNQGFLSPRRCCRSAASASSTASRSSTASCGSARWSPTARSSVDARVREGWPVLARAFCVVASPRVRNQATVGGVLADADYASDPPAVLAGARARARCCARPAASARSSMDELILGYYETCIAADELLVEVRVPPRARARAVYRKFRSRSSEDRPCVAVAAARGDAGLRVVVGAVAERRSSYPRSARWRPGVLDRELARRDRRGYAERIEPISDARGSAAYRRRVIAVEVRRAVEALA